MAVTMTFVNQARMDSENYISATSTVSGSGGQKISDVIPFNNTAQDVSLSGFDKDDLKGIYLTADYDVDVVFTLGTGNLAISIPADGCFQWDENSGITNPFAYDIVSANATNNNATTNPDSNNATLTGRIVIA